MKAENSMKMEFFFCRQFFCLHCIPCTGSSTQYPDDRLGGQWAGTWLLRRSLCENAEVTAVNSKAAGKRLDWRYPKYLFEETQ